MDSEMVTFVSGGGTPWPVRGPTSALAELLSRRASSMAAVTQSELRGKSARAILNLCGPCKAQVSLSSKQAACIASVYAGAAMHPQQVASKGLRALQGRRGTPDVTGNTALWNW